jgi:hypothetical protein
MGRILIIVGLILVVAGLVFTYAPGLFSWFGRLPGDIRIERDRGVLFVPFTSMILISIVISLLISVLLRR